MRCHCCNVLTDQKTRPIKVEDPDGREFTYCMECHKQIWERKDPRFVQDLASDLDFTTTFEDIEPELSLDQLEKELDRYD